MLAFSAPGSSLGKLSIATPKSTTFLASSSPHERRTSRHSYRHRTQRDGEDVHLQIRHGTTSGRGPDDVEAIYVNCWRNYTRFRTLYQILDDLGATIDIHRQSTPHDELVDRLQQHDGPRTVVILDEVDQLEDPSVIYDLHSLPQFALICIANKEEELFSRVDDRLVSRLRSSEHVRMDKYHDEQLYDILSARTKWGLDEDVIADDQLYRVADAAAGDARLAIGILERPPARPVVRTTSASPTIFFWTPPRMPEPRSSRRASIHSHPTSASSTTSSASTARSGRVRSTSATPRTSMTHGRNGRSVRTSRRWSSTTSSRRKGRVGTESTRSSIRQRRRRCSDRDAVSYQELNSPSPDCSWSNGSMTGDRRCRDC